MPWEVKDVDQHSKGLSDHQKQVWVNTANATLRQCEKAGGQDCEAQAIKFANAAAKRAVESGGEHMSVFDEVGKTISAATRGKLQSAFDAIKALLDLGVEAAEADVVEAVTKGEGDSGNFPASDYAYVPDPAKSSTWRLRLTATPGGPPDSGIVGAAAAALGPGFRGQRVDIPAADLAAVKARVRAAWRKANPDKEDSEMPSGIRESEVEEVAITGDLVPLIEKATKVDGTMRIKVIQPGWGSSGFYPAETLEKAAPLFSAGTHMYLDHPRKSDESERPERSVLDLGGTLESDARWEPQGPAGPGIYADAKPISAFRDRLAELAPSIGVSIRAMGKAEQGEAEGRKGPIIKEITAANSVDFVTMAGAGGRILEIFESVRGGREITEEVTIVTEEEAKALREANATLEAEKAALAEEKAALIAEKEAAAAEATKLREARLAAEAKVLVAETLAKIQMPDVARAKLTEALVATPAIKDGELDKDTYKAAIEAAARAELEYLAGATGSQVIKGMGPSASGDNGNGKELLKASFKRIYETQGHQPEAAERLASLAAGN